MDHGLLIYCALCIFSAQTEGLSEYPVHNTTKWTSGQSKQNGWLQWVSMYKESSIVQSGSPQQFQMSTGEWNQQPKGRHQLQALRIQQGQPTSKKVWQITDASIRINSPQMQQSPESFLPLQYLPSAFWHHSLGQDFASTALCSPRSGMFDHFSQKSQVLTPTWNWIRCIIPFYWLKLDDTEEVNDDKN